jgi:hypothetical protein
VGAAWLSAARVRGQSDAGAQPVVAARADVAAEAGAIDVTVKSASPARAAEQGARSVSVVDLEAARRSPADLGQVLARSEGVSVRRSGGLGAPARLALAGLSDDQIPIFMDGIPLEIAGYPFGLVNVPVGLLSRLEIYRGVVPIRLGADALGGAIDLISEIDKPGPSAVISYQAGSFDTHRMSTLLRYRHKPSGFVLRGSGFFDYARNDYPIRVKVDDPDGSVRTTTVRKRNDAYWGAAGTLETGLINRSWARRLLLRYTHAELDKRIPHSPTMAVPYAKVNAQRSSDGVSLRYDTPVLHDVSASALLAYSGRQIAFHDTALCRYDWLGRCTREVPPGGESDQRPYDQHVTQHSGFARLGVGYAPSRWAKLELSSTLSATRRSGFDRELEPAWDQLRGRRDLLAIVTGIEHQLDAWDARVQNIASFKHYVQVVRAEQLLTVGGFEAVHQDHQRVGVGDGLRIVLHEGLLLKPAYEWATRLPGPDQLFGDGMLIDANMQLVPESSHNLNLGLALDLPDTFGGSYRAAVNGFGRFSRDMIVLLVGAGQSMFDNISDARTLGVEARAGWTSPRRYLQLDANVTWQDIRNVSEHGQYARHKGDRIPNRPYLFANLTAVATAGDWFGPDNEVSLAWYGNYVHGFETGWDQGLSATRPQVPSRFVFTLEASVLVRRARRNVSSSIQVYNLNDARLYDVFGVQLPGRTVLAKLTLEV